MRHEATRNGSRWLWLNYVLSGPGAFAFGLILVLPEQRLPIALLMLLPVVVSAYFGGLGPGMIAALGGVISFEIFRPYDLPGISVYDRWSVFLIIALAIGLLNESLHRVRRRIEASELVRSITLSSITDAVITTDVDGRITFINTAAEKMSGWSAEAALGKAFSEVFPISSSSASEGRDLAREPLGGDTVHLYGDCHLRARNGALLPIEANAAPIRGGGGTQGVVLTLRDCTERRRAEEAMRERMALQERLTSIAEMLPGALHAMRLRPDGRMSLEYASSNFAQLSGLDPARLAEDASPLGETVHPDDIARVRDSMAEPLRAMRLIHVEYRIHHPSRGLIWIELHAAPTREPDGSVLLNGILFDVTQRKQVEEQLRASQLQLRAALDAGEMGILQIEPVSGAVQLDASACRLWGLPTGAEPVTLAELTRGIHPDDRDHFEQECRSAVATQRGFRTEHRVRHDDGVQWLAFHGRIDASERPQRLMGLVHDVTFRRTAEESRLRSQKLEALGVLAGGIAHDFNNLLLAISGNAKLASQDLPADHPIQTSLQEIGKAGARATALVRQILTFSHPQEQKGEWVALGAVLEEAANLVRTVIPDTIQLRISIEPDIPLVAVDAGQAHRALLNLLTNAADAVAVGGKIEARIETVEVDRELATRTADLKPGRYVRVAVIDDGAGMDAITLQRVFDPFFTTKQKSRGTGLGLAIVHGIVKANNGAIGVRSSPGNGSVFELYFPVADDQPAVRQAAAAPFAPAQAARILYVDDEEPLVFLMVRSLQRTQHCVEGFTDPHAALNAFRARPDDFNLVVSDMSMPGLSGFELAEAILAVRPHMPVVITSGYLRPEDYERARQMGIRELVLKPNTVDELSQVVARCVGPPPQ